MPGTVELVAQGTHGQHIAFLQVDHKLCLIVGAHDTQLFLIVRRFGKHTMHQFHSGSKMLLQRIEGHEGAVHSHTEFEPCAIVVEPFGKLGCGIPSASFTQHTAGKECLQLAGLMPLTGREHKIDTHGIEPLRLEYIYRYTITEEMLHGFTERK